MRDEKYTPEVGTWLKGREVAPRDSQDTARRVATRLPHVRQRSRWWPFPTFYRTLKTPTTTDTIKDQPDTIPATNNHAPTVIGRTQIMFSPDKVITAAALVIGIGGVMLIAQPFDQQPGSVPGAVTDDPAMAPSFFSGTFEGEWTEIQGQNERRDDGVLVMTGQGYAVSFDTNDPRISGMADIAMNEADYREGATTLAPWGTSGSIRTGLIRIVNDAGSWEGPFTMLMATDGDDILPTASTWLTGTDAYEGLTAYVAWDWDGPSYGHITAEGPPPAPELPAE